MSLSSFDIPDCCVCLGSRRRRTGSSRRRRRRCQPACSFLWNRKEDENYVSCFCWKTKPWTSHARLRHPDKILWRKWKTNNEIRNNNKLSPLSWMTKQACNGAKNVMWTICSGTYVAELVLSGFGTWNVFHFWVFVLCASLRWRKEWINRPSLALLRVETKQKKVLPIHKKHITITRNRLDDFRHTQAPELRQDYHHIEFDHVCLWILACLWQQFW